MDPFGWRVAAAVAGGADGAGAVPAGATADRLHAAGLPGGAAAGPRRPAPGDVALRAARRVRRLLAGVRGRVPGRRPRLGAPTSCCGWSSATGSRLAAGARCGRCCGGRGGSAAGVCFGLACGTKWNGVFVLAAFGLLVWAWDAGARRALGVSRAWARSAVADAVPAFFSLVGVALVVYVGSWGGWLVHHDLMEDSYAELLPLGLVRAGGAGHAGWASPRRRLRDLWNYHQQMWHFHTVDVVETTSKDPHPYESSPRGWLLDSRPVGIDLQGDIAPGEQGCRRRVARPASGRCSHWATRRCGGWAPARWWSACGGGSPGATGGSVSRWSVSRPAGCRGSAGTTGPSSCSTR